MRYYRCIFLLFLFTIGGIQIAKGQVNNLPLYQPNRVKVEKDWLVRKIDQKAEVYKTQKGRLVLSNGLISRKFSIDPNGATVGFENLMNGESIIRSVRPEARIQIDGIPFDIGGVTGQPIHNYLLPEWLDSMKAIPGSWKLTGFDTGKIKARFPWKKRKEWMAEDRPWPPPGKTITFHYRATDEVLLHVVNMDEEEAAKKRIPDSLTYLKKVRISVHYALYDGLPLISKWLTIENNSEREIVIDKCTSEILAATEAESSVGVKKHWRYPNMTVETDYEFGGGMSSEASLGKSVFWKTDSLYKTQVNYQRKTPCLLECHPQYGPAQEVQPGEQFESFRTWELIHDSWDRERKGLEKRKMYRTIAPWVTENPIFMHVRNADNESVKRAIDQSAEVGFEMVIMTFGSGFNLEDTSQANYRRMSELADYAHSKGIALGGYSLLASRHIGGGNDVVMPDGMKPRFGHSPCLGSTWGLNYFSKLYGFYRKTGQNVLEHDGSYPGDVCAATTHPGHRGLADSQWKQFKIIREFYQWCRANGIYLNVPDWYFLNGSNKTGMGYRETNWSLPRKQQEIIERQNIYDGTWEKTPSMGWMFVPLTEYHGGGEAATIEPLKEHLPHYGQRLADLFGAGVQAAYRGPRLYDAPETKALVKKWVDFYKTHRAILDSDIIHLRRPDGRDYDGILHVNPKLDEKGLAMIYNPLDHNIQRTIHLPLYYTGLTQTAQVQVGHGKGKNYTLSRDYSIDVPVQIEAHSETWIIIK